MLYTYILRIYKASGLSQMTMIFHSESSVGGLFSAGQEGRRGGGQEVGGVADS